MRSIRQSRGESIFYIFNYIFMTIFGFVMLLPLLTVAATSLSSPYAVSTGRVFIFPVDFTTEAWKYVLNLKKVWDSFFLTALITAIGTVLSLILNSLMAYPLSKKEFAPGRFILLAISATMIFNAPMIPYFLTVRSLGLYNSILVLIIPSLFGAYHVIVMVTFMRQLPKELEESAILDGAGYMQLLFRIVIPSSKALLATMGLFYAVSYWNQFKHPLLFIEDQKLFPIQLTIRSFITGEESFTEINYALADKKPYNAETVKAAVVIFCILPIILTYPYLQRYFIKGVMIGSIKG